MNEDVDAVLAANRLGQAPESLFAAGSYRHVRPQLGRDARWAGSIGTEPGKIVDTVDEIQTLALGATRLGLPVFVKIESETYEMTADDRAATVSVDGVYL